MCLIRRFSCMIAMRLYLISALIKPFSSVTPSVWLLILWSAPASPLPLTEHTHTHPYTHKSGVICMLQHKIPGILNHYLISFKDVCRIMSYFSARCHIFNSGNINQGKGCQVWGVRSVRVQVLLSQEAYTFLMLSLCEPYKRKCHAQTYKLH